MGLTYVPAVILGPKGRSAIKFLVDSGASLTVLPHPVWRRLEPLHMMLAAAAS